MCADVKPETIATVIHLASLTEDRAPEEQRAMIELALWVDNERARFLTGHPAPVVPHLTVLVDATYHPADEDDTERLFDDVAPTRRAVELTAAQREHLEKLDRKFVPCERCGVLAGWHAVQCLAGDLARAEAAR